VTGSMGKASSFGLGLALARPDLGVWVLDTDVPADEPGLANHGSPEPGQRTFSTSSTTTTRTTRLAASRPRAPVRARDGRRGCARPSRSACRDMCRHVVSYASLS